MTSAREKYGTRHSSTVRRFDASTQAHGRTHSQGIVRRLRSYRRESPIARSLPVSENQGKPSSIEHVDRQTPRRETSVKSDADARDATSAKKKRRGHRIEKRSSLFPNSRNENGSRSSRRSRSTRTRTPPTRCACVVDAPLQSPRARACVTAAWHPEHECFVA